ncbi:hypothetical protein [Variovorax sp. dw_308]|uniref:hypothetical protein n=1 Tax=Variovorax sp. dw_308 TaxID=2721546 RepID=UPI003526F4D1
MDELLELIGAAAFFGCKASKVGRNLFEQVSICRTVTGLRTAHQRCPFAAAARPFAAGISSIPALGVGIPGFSWRRQIADTLCVSTDR